MEKLNIKAKDKLKQTALHIAAQNCGCLQGNQDSSSDLHSEKADFIGTIRLLLDRGAEVNEPDSNQCTPLHLAAYGGCAAAIQVLVDSFATLDACDWCQRTPLHYAAVEGNTQAAEVLIKAGAAWDVHDWCQRIPVHDAASGGHVDFIEVLAKQGNSVNALSDGQWTPLHHAAHGGHPGVIRALVKHGAAVDAQDHNQLTPLHYAASGGSKETLLELIACGASVSSKDRNQQMPLHHAASNGHAEAVDILLKHGAHSEAEDRDQQTPLHHAASKGHSSSIECLLKHGASIEAQDGNKWTSLHHAASKGHLKATETLITHGANVEAQDTNQRTSLHLAASCGHSEIVSILIKHGAAVEAEDADQWTALHHAASKGQPNAIRSLLEHEAAVEAQDEKQSTPLHHAAYKGHYKAIEILVQNGSDVNECDEDHWTPLHYAASAGHTEAVKMLLVLGASSTAKNDDHNIPMHEAILGGHMNVLNVLLQASDTLAVQGRDEWTPLHFVARVGFTEAVDTLAENGAEMDAQDAHGRTPLHISAYYGHAITAEVLLRHGASQIAKSAVHRTPMHDAALHGHAEVIKVLAKHDGTLSALDKGLWTPLHYAADEGNEAAVRVLIDSGSVVDAQDMNLKTPLHHAVSAGHSDIVHILVSSGASFLVRDNANQTASHLANEEGLFALLEHLHDFCKQKRKMLPEEFTDIINAVDIYGRTPLECSSSILPFLHCREAQCLVPEAHVNVIDSHGSTSVDVGNGLSLAPVLQLSLQSFTSQEPAESDVADACYLSRRQTHMLNYFFDKILGSDENGAPMVIETDEDLLLHEYLKGIENIFKLSTLSEKTHGIVHTWPCTRVLEADQIQLLLSSKGDPEELCHRLLLSPIGKCDMESELSKFMTAQVIQFMDEISAAFCQHHPLLDFQWEKAGSTAENTKTEQPDEFDVLMVFNRLTQCFSGVENQDNIYQIGICPSSQDVLNSALPDLVQDNQLVIRKLHVKIFHIFMSVFGNASFWRSIDFSFINFKITKTGFALCVQSDTKELIVKFDLIPAFKMTDSTLYVFNGEVMLVESTVLKEIELLNALPPNAKTGYTIAKCIRSPALLHYFLKRPIISDLIDKVLPSYVLKNALFHAAATTEKDRAAIKPHEWAHMIYRLIEEQGIETFFSGKIIVADYDIIPKQMSLDYFAKSSDEYLWSIGDFSELLLSAINEMLQFRTE